MNPYAAQIHIDGSCFKNPGGQGGFAGVLEMPNFIEDPKLIFCEGYQSTTNQRMELRGLIEALDYIKQKSDFLRTSGVNNIEIWSDSSYAVRCYNSVEQWRKNGWKSSDGASIQNVDLMKKILTLKYSVRFTYRVAQVAGKSSEITKMVDKAAKASAQGVSLKIDYGYMGGKISRTTIKGPTPQFEASGQEIIIRIFGRRRMNSRNDSMYRIKFEVKIQNNIEKYQASASLKVNQLLHRWHYYRAKFNNDSRNPCIESVEEVIEEDF